MNEDTIITTACSPLPFGQRFEWHADANVIRLAPGLRDDEREEVINELQAQWRRCGWRLIDNVAMEEPGLSTDPAPQARLLSV